MSSDGIVKKIRKPSAPQYEDVSGEELVERAKQKFLEKHRHGIPIRYEDGYFYIRSAGGIRRPEFIKFLRRI